MTQTLEPVITAYDANFGEVEVVWKYEWKTKMTPGGDGSPYDYAGEGDINEAVIARKKAEAQAKLDYIIAAEAEYLRVKNLTEGTN